MYSFSPRISQPRTEFILDENLFVSEKLFEICRESRKRICILADSAIAKSAGKRLKLRLNAEMISIPGGESCKTREMKEKLEDELLKRKFDRGTLLIGMGGGAVTDLVGFIAATYMRGVPLILIPTTLLGMVDAALGGKNGVNTKNGKNLIGTIHHPIATCIDLQLLQTIPKKEWLNGLAEILKHGLIYDSKIWDLCEENPLEWNSPQKLKLLIRGSVITKTQIVEEDPDEKGLRRILNFGHTVGHGLESLSRFQMSHGEAVAIGCMAESWLSWRMGHLSESQLKNILKTYGECGFKIELPKGFSKEALLKAIHSDKKSLRGTPRFVMLEKIGQTIPFEGEFCSPVPDRDFRAMVDWLKKHEPHSLRI